jgi:hypothetical protein
MSLSPASALPNFADPRWADIPASILRGIDPGTLMEPAALSENLGLSGLKVATTTLESLRSRGGGPPFRKFGRRRLYAWGDGALWALGQLTGPLTSTSDVTQA